MKEQDITLSEICDYLIDGIKRKVQGRQDLVLFSNGFVPSLVGSRADISIPFDFFQQVNNCRRRKVLLVVCCPEFLCLIKNQRVKNGGDEPDEGFANDASSDCAPILFIPRKLFKAMKTFSTHSLFR